MSQTGLSAAQCRMARALLGWSQPELAERCGVNTQTISNFEREVGNAEARTAVRIAMVVEAAGVRLLSSGGIEPRSDLVTVLEGDDVNGQVLEDIYQSLKGSGGEVLIAGLAEVAPDDPRREFVAVHVERLKAAGISERMLLKEGDRNFIAPRSWYRYVPHDRFVGTPFQVYGDKIAMKDWGPPMRIVVVHHARFAQTMRNLFDVVWDQAKPIGEGDA
jgi:DNA-binding XRE family transcriptional regulator